MRQIAFLDNKVRTFISNSRIRPLVGVMHKNVQANEILLASVKKGGARDLHPKASWKSSEILKKHEVFDKVYKHTNLRFFRCLPAPVTTPECTDANNFRLFDMKTLTTQFP